MSPETDTNHSDEKGSAPIFEVSLPDLEKFLKRYELAHLRSTVFEKFTILILSASGFIAALAWDEALKSFFRDITGLAGSVGSKFVYAIIVTLIAVVISIFLSKRVIKKKQEELK